MVIPAEKVCGCRVSLGAERMLLFMLSVLLVAGCGIAAVPALRRPVRANASAPAATEATVTFQVSSNLVDWLAGPPNTELLSSVTNLDGTTTIKFRDLSPVDSTPYHFLRLHVQK